MRKITKEERKAYNRFVEDKNEQLAVANAASPFLIIIALALGAYLLDISPLLSKGCFGFGGLVLIARLTAGRTFNDPHNHMNDETRN